MSEERLLALLSHILAIVPGIGILGPLVIYLIKKDESPFVRDNALESLNFQLTVIILYIIAWILVFVAIGLFLFWVIAIMNAVLVIVATVRASEGQVYRYPVSLRLIK
ncbi:MAG: hypothetical protein BGO55_22610 [Sphingobacteriales bacterium 50-39]|nr:DUF4870 domain-containing protein [Sphingobacteriales bacterium]OJW58109.1 MAG: hypothetical protein BGO55_22610 [Sphingobacteriales bacterium 50-39]